jgi:hypothetical protein
MSGGTRSVGVSRVAKVAKGKKSSTGASAVKGKKTPDYRSDDFSSSSDDSTQKATKGKPSIKDLLEKIKEKDKMIRSLDLKLSNAKVTSRMNKSEGARGVEVDGRGDKLCRDSRSLLSDFFSPQIQVPQVWMEGNYA